LPYNSFPFLKILWLKMLFHFGSRKKYKNEIPFLTLQSNTLFALVVVFVQITRIDEMNEAKKTACLKSLLCHFHIMQCVCFCGQWFCCLLAIVVYVLGSSFTHQHAKSCLEQTRGKKRAANLTPCGSKIKKRILMSFSLTMHTA
jgi:hypothetical protein